MTLRSDNPSQASIQGPGLRRHRVARTMITAALLTLAACSSATDLGPARTPLQKLEKLLALDFSPAKFARRQRSFRRLLNAPAAEAQRLDRLTNAALRLPRKTEARLLTLPGTLERAARTEIGRGAAILDQSPLVRGFAPNLDAIANTTARDLERLAFLFGLERRPLAELDDQRHRTSPYDDRPEKSLWHRLARRIFP